MENIVRVAVDGPSGAGKSTIAKAVAAALGYEYIDTGAMYRAIGYGMLREGISCDPADRERLQAFLDDAEVDFVNGHVCLNGEDIADRIRTAEISKIASDCSAIDIVRAKLVAEQRAMGGKKSLVMDGRDIGTNVFPDAEYKFYLTASAEARAKRRLNDYVEASKKTGADVPPFETVLAEIERRDYNDMHRALNPLTQAEDAILIDSTEKNVGETIVAFLDILTKQAE